MNYGKKRKRREMSFPIFLLSIAATSRSHLPARSQSLNRSFIVPYEKRKERPHCGGGSASPARSVLLYFRRTFIPMSSYILRLAKTV